MKTVKAQTKNVLFPISNQIRSATFFFSLSLFFQVKLQLVNFTVKIFNEILKYFDLDLSTVFEYQ